MSNFADILNKTADTIEKPKPAPVGHYIAIVQGLPEYMVRNTKNGDSQTVQYKLKLLMPKEDVDVSALNDIGGIGSIPTMTLTIWLGTDDQSIENNMWRVKEFVEHCGINPAGKSRKEMCEAAANAQVGVRIKHRPAPDGSQTFADIERTTLA